MQQQQQQQQQPTKGRRWTIEVILTCSLVILLIVRVGLQTHRLFSHDFDVPSSDLWLTPDSDVSSAGDALEMSDLQRSLAHRDLANFTSIHTCRISGKRIVVPKTPSFIIIGAQKGGTTSLFGYLLQHPNVVPSMKWKLSNGHKHENHFFDFEWVPIEKQYKRRLRTEDEFHCFARKTYIDVNFDADELLQGELEGKHLVSFDKTPRYILRLNLPDRIRKTCPWITKLVAVIRNPVDRAFSEYNMDFMRHKRGDPHHFDQVIREELGHLQEHGLVRQEYDASSALKEIVPPKLSPEEEEEIFIHVEPKKPRYLKRGLYAIQLQSWDKTFPLHDSLLVLNADDFHFGGERKTFQRVLRHVGLPDYEIPSYEAIHSRPYKFDMLNKTRALLEAFYRPYNERLAGLLGEEWRGVWGSS